MDERKPSSRHPLVCRVGVRAITIHDGLVLLVKRGEEPSIGLWALPGGTLNLRESLEKCALRKVFEETGIKIKVGKFAYVFDYVERDECEKIKFHFVVIDLIGEYLSGEPKGSDDAEEARWLRPNELNNLPVAKNKIAALKEIGFLKSES